MAVGRPKRIWPSREFWQSKFSPLFYFELKKNCPKVKINKLTFWMLFEWQHDISKIENQQAQLLNGVWVTNRSPQNRKNKLPFWFCLSDQTMSKFHAISSDFLLALSSENDHDRSFRSEVEGSTNLSIAWQKLIRRWIDDFTLWKNQRKNQNLWFPLLLQQLSDFVCIEMKGAFETKEEN